MAEDIPALIAALDATRNSDMQDARERLVPLGPSILPHARDAYARLRTWRGRLGLVYTVIKFVRRHDDAADLALLALGDRSGQVRSVACTALAFSLRRSALPALERLREDPDPIVAADAAAAIDAIRQQNHNLFHDRNHSGRVQWHVGGSEPYL